MMTRGQTNVPVELAFSASSIADIEVDVIFAGPAGKFKVPAFWAGGDVFSVRFSASAAGQISARSAPAIPASTVRPARSRSSRIPVTIPCSGTESFEWRRTTAR